jgi:D-alanyl-lipoteichoic acid acyltransferase DltB (MBOAT superfamily)
MNFNSSVFFLFLTIVVSVNYLLSQRSRFWFLASASLFFIGWHNIESLIAVVLFSVFNYLVANKVSGKRALYIFSIGINTIAILLFNFFSETIFGFDFSISSVSFHVEKFIIALGLSFYSLQNISYLTEVYYKRMLPEKNIFRFTLYNSFFPKIISGPVMLPKEFLPQVDNTIISGEKLISGFQRLLLGLFKKMVIADRLAPAVSSVFDYPNDYSGVTILVASYLFTVQLYFDFSGYTDMALGIGRMLGYELKENFNIPFRSESVSDYWRRWHISLISWFTTYVFYPVAYRLRSLKKMAAVIGLSLTFFVSVIWHGIGITFFAWAFCHAIYLSFEVFTKKYRQGISERFNGKLYKMLGVFVVFNAVCFSNIFFRSESISRAVQLVRNEFSDFIPTDWLRDFIAPLAVGGHQIDKFNFSSTIILLIAFLLFERKINMVSESVNFNVKYVVVCILLIMTFGIFDSGTRFIYMQF